MISKNKHWIISALLCLGLLAFAYGCEPTSQSLTVPGKRVNIFELNNELEQIMLQHELRTTDINRQKEIRDLVFNQTLKVAESGSVNPIGVLQSLIGVLGGAALADDIRLRKKIKSS